MSEVPVPGASIWKATLCARCHGPQAVLMLRTEHLCQYAALPLYTLQAIGLNQSLGFVSLST